MKFSTSVDIALRILVHLAEREDDDGLASAPEVSQVLQVSYNNVVRIINRLQTAGIIITHAGRYGGMELAQTIEEITIRAVSTAIDGPTKLSVCSQKNNTKKKNFAPVHNCEISNCNIRDELIAINAQIEDLLEGVTIAGIMERSAQRKAKGQAKEKQPTAKQGKAAKKTRKSTT